MERRRDLGGILQLLGLIRDHRGALEYDWRTRFHLALDQIGRRGMSWGEAARLVTVLARDPSSQTAAAVLGWEHPASHEWLLLLSLREATVRAHYKNPEPWPTPWPTQRPHTVGTAAEQVLTQEQIDQALRDMAGR